MTTSLGQTVLFNDLTPVRVVATTNIAGTYTNGPANNGIGATLTVAASSLTIDGVLLNFQDRVLLTSQTSGFQNGVYIVSLINASMVVLQRAQDQQSLEQLKSGQFVIVGAGTANAGAVFSLVEPLPQVLGTSSFNYLPPPVTDSGGLSDVLASGNIFVGNASNIATGVAMTGDVAISNTGVSAVQAGAITIAKLEAGLQPAYIIKFAGVQANGGGSATIVITVAGVLTTDLPFVAIQTSTTAVNVQKVTPTANTITVLLSADPGAGTNLSYQVLRAAT